MQSKNQPSFGLRDLKGRGGEGRIIDGYETIRNIYVIYILIVLRG